jgi:hypothetical protein
MAAQNEFFFDTTEGKKFIANKFKFDWATGASDTTYSIMTPTGHSHKVRGDDVVFVKTCLIKGEFYPPHQVIEESLEDEECVLCGEQVHCTRLVKDPDHEDRIRVCNHCLIYTDGEGKNESGGLEECAACPRTSCSSHPDYHDPDISRPSIPF